MSDAGEHAAPGDGERPPDPYRRHRFAVDADGLPELGVAEVRGLRVTVEANPERSTGDAGDRAGAGPWWDVGGVLDRFADRLPVPRRGTASPNLVLLRGVTDDVVLWNWLQDWVAGRADPRTVRVYLLDENGARAVGWICTAATPVEWTGPELRADAPGVATERLELAHDGISAASGSPPSSSSSPSP